MNKLRNIFEILLDQIASFFPYFLTFYVICFLLSLTSDPWSSFLNWKAFNISLLSLGMISLLSRKWRLSQVVEKIKYKKRLIIKIILILSFLAYAISRGVRMVNLLILLFGLTAFFFNVNMIFVGVMPLLFLLLSVVFLLFKNDDLAELVAIYAYYSLVIVVLVQIKNFTFHKKIAIKVKDVSRKIINIKIKEIAS
ncbi:MAG: hypothetical protein A3D35_02460 [Candidatus Staskawiczbacteria bacterium RIFCSPHIGHO2_02_FULL_34_9]|uniref:Uncharacterized protein n=1 Tax=Candidatus Staskawiczbacteria bacterium RIFCSPHIGHO2_02_FULL_34_9 TaxID=1802206 RepID=A0A1G2I0K9_9BACT|nr:MAG: hypothetical protein A3D35_02460 [Candidatus Staskawiczbacteria bacterium RIFCSPHIGHO2_02_FULL_34_9]